MAGSMKGLFKRKAKAITSGDPGKFLNAEKKQWEKRGDKFDMSPNMPAAEAAIPLPDEEEIKRNKRRSASARGGGRASTIFTDADRLGP